MFICDHCGISSKEHNLVVDQTREKIYTNINSRKANKEKRKEEAKGTEIVKELHLCNDCYKKYKK